MASGASWLRGLSALRAALGIAELVSPEVLLRSVHPAPVTPRAVTVVRVLGGRQVTQAAVAAAMPSPAMAGVGAAVDALHAASMVGWALVTRHRRRERGAAGEAVAAGLLSVAGLLCRAGMRRGRPTPGGRP